MTEILDLLWAYVLVFVLAAVPFFEVIAVIPLAIIGGLSAIPVTVIALAGNLLTVFIVILFAEKIKSWRKRKDSSGAGEEQESKRFVRAKKLWGNFGLPGLALIGTAFVGSHLASFLGISFGGSKKSTLFWMTISLLLWGSLMAVLAYFGSDLLSPITKGEGFLNRIFLNN